MHLLENNGDACFLIKGFLPGTEGIDQSTVETAATQMIFEQLHQDPNNYGHLNKTENLIYALNMAATNYTDKFDGLPDNHIYPNFPLIVSPTQPDPPFSCDDITSEVITAVSPAGLPVVIDKGAVLRFGPARNFESLIDQESLTGFTIFDGSNVGIWRGLAYTTRTNDPGKPDFVGYKNILSGQTIYAFDVTEVPNNNVVLFGSRVGSDYILKRESLIYDENLLNQNAMGKFVRPFVKGLLLDPMPVTISLNFTPSISFEHFDVAKSIDIEPEFYPPGYQHYGGYLFEVLVKKTETKNIYQFIYAYVGSTGVLEYQIFNSCEGMWKDYNLPPRQAYLKDLYRAFYLLATDVDTYVVPLEIVSIFYEPADGLLVVYYLYNGQYIDAATTLIPVIGDAIQIKKILWKNKLTDEVVQGVTFFFKKTDNSVSVITAAAADKILEARGLSPAQRKELFELIYSDQGIPISGGQSPEGWASLFFGDQGENAAKAWKALQEAGTDIGDLKNNLDVVKALADDIANLKTLFASKPGAVKAWALLHEVGSQLKKDPELLRKLVDDLEEMKPGLESFIRQKGSTGVQAWKIMDEAYPTAKFQFCL